MQTAERQSSGGSLHRATGALALLRRLSSVRRDPDASVSARTRALARLSLGYATTAGVRVSFQNLTYTVLGRRGEEGKEVQILEGVSGACEAGRVLAILGTSGAGKTTLLDILAGQPCTGGVVGGRVFVDGTPVSAWDRKSISAYVQQHDVLLASATVREMMVTTALLRLPRDMDRAAKISRVDTVLLELGLEGCQHTLVGDDALKMKGISGGQRRRLSVALAMIKDPHVLLLDEPTSGLDSQLAAGLVDTLVYLARHGRTVVMTIHQPNSTITSMFDDLMLLAAGRVIYLGPWEDAVGFFDGCGKSCPTYQNPADHFMSVLQDSEAIADLADAFARRENAAADVEAGGQLASAPSVPQLERESPLQDASNAPENPFYFQVRVLAERMFKSWWRNPAMLVAEFAQYLFMAIFIGLVYLQLNDSIATGINDRVASLFFAISVLSFTPSYTAVTSWDRERVLLRREMEAGMYSISAWFAARTVTVTPVQIAQTTAYCIVTYFMVGYIIQPGPFFTYVATYNLLQLNSESIGVMSAALTSNVTFASLVLYFVMLLLLSFAGFLVADIPVYFRWLGKASYITYGYAGVVKSQFDATTFYDQAGNTISGSELIPASINNGLSVGTNTLIQLGIAVGTRLLAYFAVLIVAWFRLI